MVNMREIAQEYRLSHWAGIVQEHSASGLSIRAFCEQEGIHENRYYYWQKRLREVACEKLNGTCAKTTSLMPAGFTEIKLAAQSAPPSNALQNQLSISFGEVRITAGSDYPVDKLLALVREVVRPC